MSCGYTPLLGAFTIVWLVVLYFAAVDTFQTLSPQGCRMSWMSPSYVPQDAFNTRRIPPAKGYSLWLYREAAWDPDELRGVPVLFIPGNAGSSHQVRSIASSATRQFYSAPHTVASEFQSRSLRPLDFFTVDFNEDLSALHGPTIAYQVTYASDAISYILSRYPTNISIIVIGHSMGGVVAIALLPSPNISAIFTMSTPHTLPPACVDVGIDKIYERNLRNLLSDPTPIVSICGGATDGMIASEACILPSPEPNHTYHTDIYRTSIFSSALEGAWTGVGHREMVWCHQVRWRIARAALELSAPSLTDKGLVLDRWLRDGHKQPPNFESSGTTVKEIVLTDPDTYETLSVNARLLLRDPRNSRMYLLPVVPSPSPAAFILLLSQGSIPPVSPQVPLPLRASVYLCTSGFQAEVDPPRCRTLPAMSLRLVPNAIPGKMFPVPDEGSDESEGVVVYEVDVPPPTPADKKRWIGVHVEDGDGRGWVVAGINTHDYITHDTSVLGPLMGSVSMTLPDPPALRTRIYLPNIWVNALVVYRFTPKDNQVASSCSEYSFSPLLVHASGSPETHYFSLANSRSHPIQLHSHSSAPYIPDLGRVQTRGLNLTIYTSGCNPDSPSFDLRIDWWATMGRLATRFTTTLLCWAIGVVSLVILGAWKKGDQGFLTPTVPEALHTFVTTMLPKALLGSMVISLVPLPKQYYLGGGGEPMLLPLAPLLLLLATGLVCVTWWILVVLMWPIRKFWTAVSRSRQEVRSSPRCMLSTCVVLALVLIFIPWQVAYLGCWIIHLYTCATRTGSRPFPGSTSSLAPTPPRPYMSLDESGSENNSKELQLELLENSEGCSQPLQRGINDGRHNQHIMLLMTWLLPLAMPALIVWARTLWTAGLIASFEMDHRVTNIAPFFILVGFASRKTGPLYGRQRFEVLSVRWSFFVLALVAFVIGPRKAYAILDVAKVCIGLVVAFRIIPSSRY